MTDERRIDAATLNAARFELTPLGRRGYQPEEVHELLSRIAGELERRDATEAALRSESERFRLALREWQSRQSQRQNTMTNKPDTNAVMLLSQAQEQAEGYVAQAQDYCRRLIGQARGQAQQVLEQARRQAEEQAEAAAADYREQAGALHSAQAEEQARRLARVQSFLGAVTAAEEQLREARENLAAEVEHLVQEAPS